MSKFFLQILSEIFLILRRLQRDIIINVKTSLCEVPVSLVEFYHQIFGKYSNTKFHENPSSRNYSCSMRTDGCKDGQTDMTKLILSFRTVAKAPKSV